MRELWTRKHMFNINLIDVHLSFEYRRDGYTVDTKYEFACGCQINRKGIRIPCQTHKEVP